LQGRARGKGREKRGARAASNGQRALTHGWKKKGGKGGVTCHDVAAASERGGTGLEPTQAGSARPTRVWRETGEEGVSRHVARGGEGGFDAWAAVGRLAWPGLMNSGVFYLVKKFQIDSNRSDQKMTFPSSKNFK
jgi:hypothetical protein